MNNQFIKHQQFPVSIDVLWKFISSPNNLNLITPPNMQFVIKTKELPEEIYSGLEINYTVSPILNIPLSWTTKILEVKEPYFFIDTQLKGPYAYWQHKHTLKEISGGTEMQDEITYRVPFFFVGDIANKIFVRKKLESIFHYRQLKMEAIFGRLQAGIST